VNQFELRMIPTSISTTDDGKMYCEGLVNKTDSWSNELGVSRKFVEKVNKGVFTRALQSAPRIDFLAEHDTKRVLATTENGSLELFEDEEGLKMRAEICPTSYGRDAYALMHSGIVRHMSFGMKVLKDSWTRRTASLYERVIEELALAEVSVVRNPAYSQSAISARNIEILEDVEIPSDVEDSKEEAMEQEKNEVVVEATELKEVVAEQRAYFEPIYSKAGAINRCLDTITQATELIAFANENGSDTKIVGSLQGAIQAITDYMISLTMNQPKEVTVGDIVADVVSEVVDSIVEDRSQELDEVEIKEEIPAEVESVNPDSEKEEVTEEATEVSEDSEISEVKEVIEDKEEVVEEKPATDFAQYRNKIKEDIKLWI